MTRKHFIQGLGAGLFFGAGTGFYTWQVEPHWVEITHRKLSIARLPESLIGRTLVQMSDLHIGPRVDDDYLRRSFAAVKSLAPDIVVYTGDFTDYTSKVFSHAREMFAALPLGKLATLGVLGNHDYGPAWSHPEVADQLVYLAGLAGVRILRNAVAEVEGLQVIGLDDWWAKRFDPQAVSDIFESNSPSLVLSHNPDTADLPVWGNFKGWILAGHTHGGQCKPPFLPPPLLPVKNRRYTAGEFILSNGRKMYINRGLGHLTQVRFNVRPEITVFELCV